MSAIAQECSHCDRKLKIPAKFAGKRVKCPGCDRPVMVLRIDSASTIEADKTPPRPAIDNASPAKTSKPSLANSKTIGSPPAKSRPSSQATLSPKGIWIDYLVLPCMLLLAASYALLILGVIAGLIWHVFFNYKNILAIGEEASFLVFLIYIGVIVFGIGLAFFLLKPLMATRQKEICRIVQPKNEPKLFFIFNQISRRFGIQGIDYCEFDNSYGMTARFVNDKKNPGKKAFVLRIGLPFIVGQQQQAMVALFATEMLEKSFEQRSPTGRIIRNIHNWFSDVAQVRDSWDHRLAIIKSRRGLISTPFIALFQLCVFLTRRILLLFQFLSRILSNISCRNYYRNSDDLAATFAGRKDLIRGDRESFVSRSAYQRGLVDFVFSYASRPIDDITGIVESRRKNLDDNELEALTKKADRRWTRPWDSRSSLRRQLRLQSKNADSEEKREIEKYIGSAKKFFNNFKSSSRTITADVHNRLVAGDFVQVRQGDHQWINIALTRKLPTGMSRVGGE